MCLQFLRIWGWTIAKAAEKKIYYNLWIVQPITLYVFESRNKIFQSHHHKKVSCKTFYLFLSSTMCYSLRRTWRHLQVGAMVDGTVWTHVKKKLGGGEWRGWRGQHVQTDTPLQFMWQFYVIFLTCCKESHSCHFDWPIKHSNLWSWSCQVQLWFQTPPQSSWSQQAVTWLLWRGWLLQLSSSWSFDDIKIFCAILDTCPVIKVLS